MYLFLVHIFKKIDNILVLLSTVVLRQIKKQKIQICEFTKF